MEERLEFKAGQRGKDAAGREPVGGPVKNRGGHGPEENGGGEIGEQSGCVFQEANVRFPPDAESTHMEGEGRGGTKARSPRDQIRRRVATPGEICRRRPWTYYERPLLEDLLALKDVVFRKYQRRRAASEDVESIDKLLQEYAGNE